MEIIKLGDICIFQSGTTKLPKSYKKNGTTFFINYKDVYSAKALYKNDLAKISIFSHINYEKNMVFKNDLLITCSSETSIDNGMVSIYVDEYPVLLNGFCKKITVDKKKVISKYLFFLLNNKGNRKKISACSNGITRHNILWNQLKKIKLYIPNISIQQSIIDIIEPKEELFLKFKNLVRIDNIENCKNDIKDLIDIIEPFELKKTNLIDMKLRIKDFIKNHYDYNSSENYVFFDDYCNFISNKYIDQKKYIDTSMVKELEILEPEKIMIKKSRANLSLSINSIIFSKMNGENKVYPIYNDSLLKNVYSTGFYNVSSDNNFHLLGFMLSKSFLEQKSNASVGTLMAGLNSNSFKKIYFKKPKDSKTSFNFLLEYINLIDLKIKKTNEIISNIIELYTK